MIAPAFFVRAGGVGPIRNRLNILRTGYVPGEVVSRKLAARSFCVGRTIHESDDEHGYAVNARPDRASVVDVLVDLMPTRGGDAAQGREYYAG